MDDPRPLTQAEFDALKPGDEVFFDVTEGNGDTPGWEPYKVVSSPRDGRVEVKHGSDNVVGGHKAARREHLAHIPGM